MPTPPTLMIHTDMQTGKPSTEMSPGARVRIDATLKT